MSNSKAYERIKRSRTERAEYVEDQLAKHECACGEDSPSTLVFVGQDWNTVPIGQLVNRNMNWASLVRVLRESTVMCMNCFLKRQDNSSLERMAAGN